MAIMSEQQYLNFAKKTYDLIMSEFTDLESDPTTDWLMVYPNLVYMYEYFRLVRGEAFNNARPVLGRKHVKIHHMEHDILERLKLVRSKLDLNDDKAKFYLKLAQKSFLPNTFLSKEK